MKRLNLDVADDLFSDFKAHCVRKGVTMREEVIGLICLDLEAEGEEANDMERIVVYLNEKQAQLLDKLKKHLGAKSRYAICKRYILEGMRRDLEKVGGGEER